MSRKGSLDGAREARQHVTVCVDERHREKESTCMCERKREKRERERRGEERRQETETETETDLCLLLVKGRLHEGREPRQHVAHVIENAG